MKLPWRMNPWPTILRWGDISLVRRDKLRWRKRGKVVSLACEEERRKEKWSCSPERGEVNAGKGKNWRWFNYSNLQHLGFGVGRKRKKIFDKERPWLTTPWPGDHLALNVSGSWGRFPDEWTDNCYHFDEIEAKTTIQKMTKTNRSWYCSKL